MIFLLDDQKFIAINWDSKHHPTNANAYILKCTFKGQAEYFAEKLSAGGEKSDGGWIKDKFGVSWNFGPDGVDDMLYRAESSEKSEWR